MGIVEAMDSGVPVVAWNNGGPAVTARDRLTGYLAKPYDTGEFAERLLTLSTNPELAERMGRPGHKRAVEMFSYQRHSLILEQSLLLAIQGLADTTGPEGASSPSWAQK